MAYLPLGDQIQVGKNVANIDAKYGPYQSRQAAQDALGESGMDVIAIGLTVGIVEDGKVVEYWWQGGTELANLVKKHDSLVKQVDLKNLTTNSTIPYTAKDCMFTYDDEAVSAVPCIYEQANCTLIRANIYKNEQTIDKIYLIAGRTILGVWDFDNRPAWTDSFLVSVVAGQVSELFNKIKWK